MQEDDIIGLILMIGLLVVLLYAILAMVAGNIANQLLAPVPSVAGPIGAAVALGVFIILILKTADTIFN